MFDVQSRLRFVSRTTTQQKAFTKKNSRLTQTHKGTATQDRPVLGKPFGTMGMERMRVPVAAKMAFAIAGEIPTIGVSPAPAGGKSLRSTSPTTISGMSLKRGTR